VTASPSRRTTTPANAIDRITRTHFVVKSCVACGEEHCHGSAEDLDVGEHVHRGAHCTGGSGYWLKRTAATTEAEE
jgi:hypothetical protein